MDLSETAASPAGGLVSSFSAEFLYTTPGELSKGAGAACAANGNHARGDSELAPRGADVPDKICKVEGGVTGPFYGDACQLAAQCIGILANIIYVGLIGTVLFK